MSQTPPAGPEGFAGYLTQMDADGAPLLGHLVLYSVFEGTVTHDDTKRWFTELGLDMAFVPPPIRRDDAFEKVTGPSGVRRCYPVGEVQTRRQRRHEGPKGRVATLMIRPVSRDAGQIVRHLVREVRDEQATKLSYDTHLADCAFTRDTSEKAQPGSGSLQVTADRDAIAHLPEQEQAAVGEVLAGIRAGFDRNCRYLTADRLRAVIRAYVESLNAIRVRPTGGVYFLGRQHAGTLGQLRELVARFGGGSNLARIPLPDHDEMREMVITAFINRQREELDKLARDIAAATRDGEVTQAAVAGLHRRFRQLQASTTEHSALLGTSIDDTAAAMRLVNAQLMTLLTKAS